MMSRLCVITVAAFLFLQVFLFAQHKDFWPIGESDGKVYLGRMAHGPIIHAHGFHGTGFPIASRALASVSGLSIFSAGKVVTLLGMALFLGASFCLFSLCCPKQRYLALALLVSTPVLSVVSCKVISDTLALGLAFSTIALLTRRWGAREPYAFMLAGALAAAAYYARHVYLLLLVVPILTVCYCNKRSIKAFYAGFALLIAPLVAVNALHGHGPFWNTCYWHTAYAMFYPNLDNYDAFPVIGQQYSGYIHLIAQEPLRFAKHYANQMIAILSAPLTMLHPLLLLAPLGFFLKQPTRQPITEYDAMWQLKAFSITYCALLALAWPTPRYCLPLLPVLIAGTARATQDWSKCAKTSFVLAWFGISAITLLKYT